MGKSISIIIPVLNEAENLRKLIPFLLKQAAAEIIVVDGGSTDDSLRLIESFGLPVFSSAKGRAIQLNFGAKKAGTELLYFLHADCLPPESFITDIQIALEKGFKFGCFRSMFNTTNKFLRFNSYFTRFKGIIFRGGGQSLWIKKDFFEEVGGFKEELILMEEYDFILRAQKRHPYYVIPKNVLVSTRTYEKLGAVKMQFLYAMVFVGFFLGFKQQHLKNS